MRITVIDVQFEVMVEFQVPTRRGVARYFVTVQFNNDKCTYETILNLLEHEITPENIIYLVYESYKQQQKNQERIDTLNTAIINAQEGLQGA